MEINKNSEGSKIGSRKNSINENYDDYKTTKDLSKEQRAIFDINAKQIKQDEITKINRRQSTNANIKLSEKDSKIKEVTRNDIIFK